MPRRITILGSTGSVGANTAGLVATDPEREVVALTGGRNVALLARQAVQLRAGLAVTAHEDCHDALREALAGTGIRTAAGAEALVAAAGEPADWVMSAIVGVAGLAPGLAALRQGATLALANKESLVCAGPLLLETARVSGATILPVDSEHSAVFQALRGEDMATVEKITITASGGAFRDWSVERMARATPDQASAHPNWEMGQRITIDSASLFNKALELIETHEFFGLAPDRIDAVIHPESLVHALVGFVDGAVIAHLGPPDMRHAIGYALTWPARVPLPVERLDLARIGRLSFAPLDEGRWPAIRLAREAMAAGGLAGAVLNGAKERALDAFLDRRIGFLDMARVVGDVLAMTGHARHMGPGTSLDAVLAADGEARARADEAMERVG